MAMSYIEPETKKFKMQVKEGPEITEDILNYIYNNANATKSGTSDEQNLSGLPPRNSARILTETSTSSVSRALVRSKTNVSMTQVHKQTPIKRTLMNYYTYGESVRKHKSHYYAHHERSTNLPSTSYSWQNFIELNGEDISFRCSFGDCSAMIYGNIQFVCHLWAHYVEFTQLHSLSLGYFSCPQCAHRFKRSYQFQAHYTRAHCIEKTVDRSNFCSICEEHRSNFFFHASSHHDKDLSFKCLVTGCSFQSTQRMELNAHYIEKHTNCPTVFCPFCTFVERNGRTSTRTTKDNVISKLVKHMAEHSIEEKVLGCRHCSYVFVSKDMCDAHEKTHKKLLDDSTEIYEQKLSGMELMPKRCGLRNSTNKVPNCSSCRHNPYDTMFIGCDKCSLDSQFSNMVVQRKPEKYNKTIGPIISSVKQRKNKFECFSCGCGFVTYDGGNMARHRLSNSYCEDLRLDITNLPIHKISSRPDVEDFEDARTWGVAFLKPETKLEQHEVVGGSVKKAKRNCFALSKMNDIEEIKSFYMRTQEHRLDLTIHFVKKHFS